MVSLFAAFATLGVGILKQTSLVLFSHAALNSTTYGTFSSLVGFMVVFSSPSNRRWWAAEEEECVVHEEQLPWCDGSMRSTDDERRIGVRATAEHFRDLN